MQLACRAGNRERPNIGTAIAPPSGCYGPLAGFLSRIVMGWRWQKFLRLWQDFFWAVLEFSRQKAQRMMVSVVDDALVCERLIAGLARVGLHNMQCSCNQGVVMLSGDLTNPDDRTLACAVGRTTAGVTRLVIK